jgi:hypothetical protein
VSDSGAGTLYFHSPCFDGIISAVLASEFLEHHRGWAGVDAKAVNYDDQVGFLDRAIRPPAAVVDFLYHPDAAFWADHHQTAFLTPELREDFRTRSKTDLIYDDQAPSCAGLLHEHLSRATGLRDSRCTELARWADKIDAAAYDSVEEAIRADAPALRLNASLTAAAPDFCEWLVTELRKRDINEVADSPLVRARADRVMRERERGLQQFRPGARLEDDGIVVFDVDGRGTAVSRYSPYFFFPEARYSVGILRTGSWVKVTAMRNPWRNFPSVALGTIASRFGGGGHHRVGSVHLSGADAVRAEAVLAEFVAEIRRQDKALITRT